MARCPFAAWKPVPSHGGRMVAQLGACLHVTTNHADPHDFFANVRNQASSHFWVADDGTIEQYIDTDFASWAQAAGNYTYVSIEVSGTVDIPMNPAQLHAVAAIYRWGHEVHGWPIQLANVPGVQAGFIYHAAGGAAWGGHPCPGPIRIAQRPAILDLVKLMISSVAVPVAVPPVVVSTVTDKELGTVQKQLIMIPVANGCGDEHTAIPFASVVGIMKQGSDPEADHEYWSGAAQGQERDGNLLITVTDARHGLPESLVPLNGQAGVFVTTVS